MKGKRVQLWKSPSGKWYFHLKNKNGLTTHPSQGYSTKSNAKRAIESELPDLPIEIIMERVYG